MRETATEKRIHVSPCPACGRGNPPYPRKPPAKPRTTDCPAGTDCCTTLAVRHAQRFAPEAR